MNSDRRFRVTYLAIALAACLPAAACSNSEGSAPKETAILAPRVSVIEAAAQDVPIFNDYAAQTYARDMVEVRGRVDGYVEKRFFQVGTDVKAGQTLYILDLRPYQAAVQKARGDLAESEANLEFARRQVALAQAEAEFAQAQANLLKARQDVERLRPLVKEDAASQQDLDNAAAALQANEANVKAKKANVEQAGLSTRAQIDTGTAKAEANRALLRTAELNLEYATIEAPISGRIGDSLIQVGGLVTRNSSQPLTTIVPLDPIWVRFKVSEAEYIAYQRRWLREKTTLPLELILGDNTMHPHGGRFENVVNQVDPRTGTLEVQATFPNPEHAILPGQFGRVRVRTDERKQVILVPQKAIQELQGTQSVLTVGPDNKVIARAVVTGDRVDNRWIIEQGLRPGDKVVVEGVQKARPGALVDPRPYRLPSAQNEKPQGR